MQCSMADSNSSVLEDESVDQQLLEIARVVQQKLMNEATDDSGV